MMCTAEMEKEFDTLSAKIKEKQDRGGSGSGDCYVGHWTSVRCGNGKKETLQLNADGTGYLALPDCNNICEDMKFPFNYTISGGSITLHYTNPPNVYCQGYGSQPVDKPKNDTFSFTCSGNTLTTFGSSPRTYTR